MPGYLVPTGDQGNGNIQGNRSEEGSGGMRLVYSESEEVIPEGRGVMAVRVRSEVGAENGDELQSE